MITKEHKLNFANAVLKLAKIYSTEIPAHLERNNFDSDDEHAIAIYEDIKRRFDKKDKK